MIQQLLRDALKAMSAARLPGLSGTASTAGAMIGFVALLALLALAAFWGQAPPWSTIALISALGAALTALSYYDLQFLRLPNALTTLVLISGLLVAAVASLDSVKWHALASVLGFTAFWGIARLHEHLCGTQGLGLGDAKLLAAGGAWVGVAAMPTLVLVAAGLALTTVAVVRCGGGKISRRDRIPFGPFLALGIWYAWLFGPLL